MNTQEAPTQVTTAGALMDEVLACAWPLPRPPTR